MINICIILKKNFIKPQKNYQEKNINKEKLKQNKISKLKNFL